MKLLFDANLSPRLIGRLIDLFPGSVHVFDTGLARFTADELIWQFAREHGFTIVTADSDFIGLAVSQRTATTGHPKWNACCDEMQSGLRN